MAVRPVSRVSPRPRAPDGAGSAVLAAAVAAPVVLVAGSVLARFAQPRGTYDPVHQTISTLAGRGATDRWLMAATLVTLGVLYLTIAAGLRACPTSTRLVLGVGALAVVVTASAPQPAHGSSVVHMAGMVVATLAFVGWPLTLAAQRGLDPGLRRSSAAATGVLVLGLGWLCAQAWTDGTWLGVAERALLLGETVWPIRVAAASWRAGAASRTTRTPTPTPTPTEVATVVLTAVAPVVLLVGLAAAQLVDPVSRPLDRSLSALAAHGAPTQGIMTTTLGTLGVITVLVAAGLRRAPTPARLLLALGGAMVVVAAVAAQPALGSSVTHLVSAGVGWVALSAWPLGLAGSSSVDHRLRWTSALATAVLVVLLGWFAVELVAHGSWYGVSQRVLLAAELVWPVRTALHAAHR